MSRKGKECISHSLTDESVLLCSQLQIWTCIALSPGTDSGITNCLSLQTCSLLCTCSSILSPHSARAGCPWTCGPAFSLLFSCPVQHEAFRLTTWWFSTRGSLRRRDSASFVCFCRQPGTTKVRLKLGALHIRPFKQDFLQKSPVNITELIFKSSVMIKSYSPNYRCETEICTLKTTKSQPPSVSVSTLRNRWDKHGQLHHSMTLFALRTNSSWTSLHLVQAKVGLSSHHSQLHNKQGNSS